MSWAERTRSARPTTAELCHEPTMISPQACAARPFASSPNRYSSPFGNPARSASPPARWPCNPANSV